MRLLAVDPGQSRGGFVVLDSDSGAVLEAGELPMEDLVAKAHLLAETPEPTALAVELYSRAMMAGFSDFETCYWVGDLRGTWRAAGGHPFLGIRRHDVFLELLGQRRGGDPLIRRALIDLYGGGEVALARSRRCPRCRGTGQRASLLDGHADGCRVCGDKGRLGEDGPLRAVAGHAWQALGVGVVAIATRINDGRDRPALWKGEVS